MASTKGRPNTSISNKYNSDKFCFFAAIVNTKKIPDANARKPEWFKHWATIILVEMIGTFLLVLMITAPSSIIDSDSTMGQVLQYKVFLAFYISVGIGILVVIFGLVSANLNPAVTIGEIMSGSDSVKLGVGKIAAQFVGAIMASFLVWYLANEAGQFDSTSTLGAPKPGVFLPKETIDMTDQMGWWWMIIFIFEIFGTFLLMWTVFGKRHKKMKNSLVKLAAYITITLFFVIWINEITITATINPARLMGPAMVATWMGGSDQVLEHSMLHLVPQLITAFTYGAYLQQKNNAKITIT